MLEERKGICEDEEVVRKEIDEGAEVVVWERGMLTADFDVYRVAKRS